METLDIQGKVEEAFERVLQPYIETGDLSLLQLVTSFFTGKPRKDRLSVTVPNCERGLMGENGEPLTWNCPVQIEVTTNGKDDGVDHPGLSAITALATYGGATFLASLNAAMEDEGFNALLWESDTRRESEKDGTVLRTRIFGTLEVQPWKSGE